MKLNNYIRNMLMHWTDKNSNNSISHITLITYTISRSSKNSNNVGSMCNMSGQYM